MEASVEMDRHMAGAVDLEAAEVGRRDPSEGSAEEVAPVAGGRREISKRVDSAVAEDLVVDLLEDMEVEVAKVEVVDLRIHQEANIINRQTLAMRNKINLVEVTLENQSNLSNLK